MIFDQENLFIDKGLTSDVIANVGGGDANKPLFLVAFASTALAASGAVSIALQTSDVENFGSGVVTLGTYDLAKAKTGMLAAAQMPYGAKKFLRIAVSGSPSAGALTVGLVADVPNWYK